MAFRFRLLPAFALAVCVVWMLTAVPAHAVELTIRNDLRDGDEGSVLFVDKARSKEAPSAKIRFKIFPGEIKHITNGNVTSFVLVRIFPRHKLKYDIACDPDAEGSATLTMLQIHNEELPKGCRMIRVGHWSRRTGTNWEQRSPAPPKDPALRRPY